MLTDGTSVEYVRDVSGRIVQPTEAPVEGAVSVVRHGLTGSGDGAGKPAGPATLSQVVNPKFIAGAINIAWGTGKIVQGLTLLAAGKVAEASFVGIPVGVAADAYGAYHVITGG